MSEEIWKCVVGFEGIYDVSDRGRLRRLYAGGEDGWRILKPSLNNTGTGYYQVSLSKGGKVARNTLVHHLVAEAFIGPRPKGLLVLHNDGNSRNNRSDNLRYGTGEENMADRVIHGTANRGERHGISKLTDAAVREIRRRYVKGNGRQLAKEFDVSPHTITRIANGKIWIHVKEKAA